MTHTHASKSIIILVAVFLTLELWSNAARADSVLVVTDSESGEINELIQDAAMAKLRELGWTIRFPEREFDPEQLSACLRVGLACFKRRLGATADAIVILRVRNLFRLPGQMTGTLIDGATGKQVGRTTKDITSPEMETLRTRTAQMVVDLLDKAPSLKLSLGLVAIRVRPVPGHISVDGRSVGPSDLELPLAVGRHQIKVSRKGFQSVTRKLTVSRGSQKIQIRLKPASVELQDNPQRLERERFRYWKWAALGAGAASTTLGVTLIAIHDSDGRKTRTPGFIATGIGVGLIGTGVVMWVLDRSNDRPKQQFSVRSSEPGSWSVSIGGAF